MEGFKVGLQSLVKNSNKSSDRAIFGGGGSDFSTDEARILIRRGSSQVVSVWTCSKICAVGFLVGVVVGYTLKRRVRRWAGKLLKRLKDD